MMTSPYDFSRITTRNALIAVLGIDDSTLEAVRSFNPNDIQLALEGNPASIQEISIPMFLSHRIPKKNKSRGYRTVWEPLLLKGTYKTLSRRLDAFFRHHLDGYPNEGAFGYRSGRNIRENARVHSGSAQLISLDIADFFPSISKTRIQKLFQDMGLNETVSELLSSFVTIDGSLALGLPTSPVISNAIALPIDKELSNLAILYNSRYSRYADDITFSGKDQLPDLNQVEECLERNGFQIAHGKTRRSKRGQSHYVTGLSVTDPAQPHVPRKRKRTLRQKFYYMRKFGLDDHFRRKGINDANVMQQEINSTDGMVKFIAHHEPQIAAKLKSSWNAILNANNAKPSFAPKHQNRDPFFIFVDEAEFKRSGSQVLALAMSVSQHEDHIYQGTKEVLYSEIQDLWAAGNISSLQEKGLHFADATEDLKYSYVKRLATMPFEGYVAFHKYIDPRDYEKTYMRLLGSLVSRRLIAAESKSVHFYFEENSKVSQRAIRALIEKSYNELKRTNNKHPEAYFVDFVSKPHFGISVPDFLLGVLGRYLMSKPHPAGKPSPRDHLMFERLRDKYRLILDVSTWTEYSRRQPVEPWTTIEE